jgi:hypothetical protein
MSIQSKVRQAIENHTIDSIVASRIITVAQDLLEIYLDTPSRLQDQEHLFKQLESDLKYLGGIK